MSSRSGGSGTPSPSACEGWGTRGRCESGFMLKTPEMGKRPLVGLLWGLVGPFIFLFSRRGRAPRGRPCQSSGSSARGLRRARWPPRLRAVHILCIWLAIWAAQWLLSPGVARVCLSVPGRAGRPRFAQVFDSTLGTGILLKAVFVGALTYARLCDRLVKWRRRASRVQNALEVQPSVVRLRSRGAGVGRRGPVVTMLGWASVRCPEGEPARGRSRPWTHRWWAEGHGGVRGERVLGHVGFGELRSACSSRWGSPRGGHAAGPE